MKKPLPYEQLRWRCKQDTYPCLHEGTPCGPQDVLGQEQAVRAIKLGLSMRMPGYNIYVSGSPGLGRTHTLKQVLEQLPLRGEERPSCVYVNNFERPGRPRLIELPPGHAKDFRSSIHRFTGAMMNDLARTLEGEAHQVMVGRIKQQFEAERKTQFESLAREVEKEGFAIVTINDHGAQAILPSIAGRPVPPAMLKNDPEARGALVVEMSRKLRPQRLPSSADERERMIDSWIEELEVQANSLAEQLEVLLKQTHRAHQSLRLALSNIEEEATKGLIEQLLKPVRDAFSQPEVSAYLDEVQEFAIENRWLFLRSSDTDPRSDSGSMPLGPKGSLSLLDVNVIHEGTAGGPLPVVFERHPNFTNVFGTIEREPGEGDVAGFHLLRGGALLRADGGVLVMYARDVLLEPGVWRNLVRTISAGALELKAPDSALYFMPSTLKPDPINLDVKVILIGEESLYQLLSECEENFSKIFKIKAEFRSSMQRSPEGISKFVGVVRQLIAQNELPPIDALGMAALLEHAVRLTGRRDRVSIRLGQISDILTESGHLSRSQSKPVISADQILGALEDRRRRQSLVDEYVGKEIEAGTIRIDVRGSQVGQINGLAVLGGAIPFGKPARITAAVGAGTAGVVNIEREVRLSGPAHDKGVMLLSGYLRARYGRYHPLALSASLAFEQSYGEVDGDSASLAELYALLSAIADQPIRQGFAVTGSVDQLGRAQAIGGVNEKIEGFFEVMKRAGFPKPGGVLIPAANLAHLMLRDDIAKSCVQGDLPIYAIEDVDEGIELLFGISGEQLHEKVETELERLRGTTAGQGPSAPPLQSITETTRVEPVLPRDPTPPGPLSAPV